MLRKRGLVFGIALHFLRGFIFAASLAFASCLGASAQELSAERIAQQVLVERGYKISVDGLWGPRSAEAMKALQRELGLPETGLPDPQTMDALAAPPVEEQLTPSQPAAPPAVSPEVSEPEPRPIEPADISTEAKPTTIEEAQPASLPKAPAVAEQIQKNTQTAPDPRAQTTQPPTDQNSLLLGLATLTAIGAIVVYVISRRRERRYARSAINDLTEQSSAQPASSATSRPPPTAQREPTSQSAAEGIRRHNAAVYDSIWAAKAVPSPPSPAAVQVVNRPRVRETRIPWVAGDETVTVGSYRLRGLIYVGETLKPQNGWGQRDNCLIVPSLPLAARADVSGQYLDYWPSYERISPSSRKAYLDWLVTDRADPTTPIGYVFLYFYGLERRLMLDGEHNERDAVIQEVQRLVGIYGGNGSFRRYSTELLSAASAQAGGRPSAVAGSVALGDVPIADRLELGRLAASGQPIPPQLFFSLVANHPETRLRAPVRRVPELIGDRFISRVTADHPSGFKVSLPRRVPMLEVSYRSASSTFEVEIISSAQAVPDISQLPEPLGYGRTVLDAVTDELDGYSREMGKANGAPTSIAGLSKLPPELRHKQAMAVAGQAMEQLNAVADGKHLYRLADLLNLVGLKVDVSTKTGLKDLSQCLAGWGIGIVPDPHFAPKILADRDAVLVFRLDMTKPAEMVPSDQYRLTYMCLALGLVVASSDGTVTEAERRMLSRLILDTPGLSEQEQRRLVSDFRWLEASPLAVSDLRQSLKETTPEFRTALMNSLIPVAIADGNMDAGEVDILEKLAKILGLDPATVYDTLHRTAPNADEPEMIEAPGQRTGPAVSRQQRPAANGVDADRLAAIRAETAHASILLNNIFVDEEELAPVEAPPPLSRADGELDQRHRVLLNELMTQSEWSEKDFGRLVRTAGLIPGSAKTKINDWSLEMFDELILEGETTIVVNSTIVLEAV